MKIKTLSVLSRKKAHTYLSSKSNAEKMTGENLRPVGAVAFL